MGYKVVDFFFKLPHLNSQASIKLNPQLRLPEQRHSLPLKFLAHVLWYLFLVNSPEKQMQDMCESLSGRL